MKKGAKKNFDRGKVAKVIKRTHFDKMDKDLNYQNNGTAFSRTSKRAPANISPPLQAEHDFTTPNIKKTNINLTADS